ncbi:unnamed protein product [Discosporangium mesarthrocarpum]
MVISPSQRVRNEQSSIVYGEPVTVPGSHGLCHIRSMSLLKLLASLVLLIPEVEAFVSGCRWRSAYTLPTRRGELCRQHCEGTAEVGDTTQDAFSSFVSDEVAQIKNQLLQVAAATERGNLASKDQREDVELLVGRLAELNMDGTFSNNEDMLGSWTLVYSSSQAFRSSPFFATFQALLGRDGLAERIFALTDSFPSAKIGQARQIVDGEANQLISRVEMSLWPYRWISGVVETRSRIVNGNIAEQLEVIVDKTGVRDSTLGKINPILEDWKVPVDQLSERFFDKIPRIVLETMFLDKELRVSGLPDGNFLIYVKDYT